MRIMSLPNKINKKHELYRLLYLFGSMLAVYIVIWSFTGMWPWISNPYNSYSLQAARWLHGHLDLGQNYTYLELAEYGGKYFVSFPPFPSFVMLPFVVLFGSSTPDGWIALFVSLIGAAYVMKLFVHFGSTEEKAVFWTLFVTVASNMLFVCINGWVWFIAQNMCFTLTIMAFYYAVCGKGGLSLAFWACSVGCRPFQIIYIVIIAYFLLQHINQERKDIPLCRAILKKWYWIAAPCIIAAIYMILNFARFGSILEFGHTYLPEFQEAPLGQFHPNYIQENLPKLFALPPVEKGIVQFPKFNGFAFFIVSPIYISYAVIWIRALIKKQADKIHWIVPLLIAVHFLILTAHKTMGGFHFGNRYTNDALPVIMLSIAMLLPTNNQKYHIPLFLFGLALNIVGTIAVYNNWI